MQSVISQTTTATEYLLESYGPLMTIEDLSEILKRPVCGVRYSLVSNSPFSKRLKQARKKIGKRVYFSTIDIADIIRNSNYE